MYDTWKVNYASSLSTAKLEGYNSDVGTHDQSDALRCAVK